MADSQSEATTTLRRRGRPLGSKNKPKTPVTAAPNPFPRAEIITVPPGSNVIESVVRFGRSINASVMVTGGSGVISRLLVQSLEPHVPPYNVLRGVFNLLSISGTYLHSASPSSPTFVMTFAGKDGRAYGGTVRGPFIAHTHVFLAATVFMHATSPAAMQDALSQSVNQEQQLSRITQLSGGYGGNNFAADSSIPMNNYGGGSSSGNTMNYQLQTLDHMGWDSPNSFQPY